MRARAGWIAAAATATLYALCLPPASAGWLAWIALAPLLAATSGTRVVRAGWLGLVSGVATAAAVAPWLPALVADYFLLPGPWGLLASLAAWMLSGGLPFAVFAAWHAWATRLGPVSPWLVGAAWSACEFGRAHWLLANPWGLLPHSQASALPVAQVADLVGPFGIGLLLAAANAALVQLVLSSARDARARRSAVGVALAVVAVLVYGAVRLRHPFASGAPVAVGLVQASVPRAERWKPESLSSNLDRYVELGDRLEGAQLLLWPELAIEGYSDQDADLRRRIARATNGGKLLLAGSLGVSSERRDGWRTNAVFLFDGAEILARYDKRRLVPFSETRSILRWLGDERDAFEAGRSDDPIASPGGAIGVAICSEAMFPSIVRERVRRGAEWLVNPSNDEWFTSVAAARHQLAVASLRAIETRRWIARPTTTGISAIVDPHGRVVQEAPHGVPAALSGEIHAEQALTAYVRHGDWVVLLGAVALCLDAFSRARGRRRGTHETDGSTRAS